MMRFRTVIRIFGLLILLAGLFLAARHFRRHPPGETVHALTETAPVPSGGDAADDPCIWIHPERPELSVVIGTDKKGGLGVYDLEGRQLQYLDYHQNERVERPNNIDICQQVTFHGETFALLAASEKEYEQIILYRIDPETRTLREIAEGRFKMGVNPGGVTFYQSGRTGRLFVYVVGEDLDEDAENWIEQWEIGEGEGGRLTAEFCRRFLVGSDTEGLVADNELGWLYAAEENVGIWKYAAEPDADTERKLVASVKIFGRLNNDVEGLALIRSGPETGYLIASCQGSDSFVILSREGDNEYLCRFRIKESEQTDEVTHTDGIDGTPVPLGPLFPEGVFVAQDDENGSENQNFKLVPWQRIRDLMD